MGQLETNLKNKVESELQPNQRLFRVNSGMGWVGKILDQSGKKIILGNPRPFYGMPKGTPDMIGFDSIEITQDMVGKRVAVFVGSELKATKNDKLKEFQRRFKKLIVDMGGIHREHREDGSVIETTNL